MSRVNERGSKRTNSLAFASVDCHTCSNRGVKCDRRRPQCLTCLDRGTRCAGFVTPLSWDQRRMWVADGHQGNNKSLSGSILTRPNTSKAPRRFRFVGASAKKGQSSAIQQTASASSGMDVAAHQTVVTSTDISNTIPASLIDPSLRLYNPVVEHIAIPSLDNVSVQEQPPPLPPTVGDHPDTSVGSTISVDQQPIQNLSQLDFTSIPPDLISPVSSDSSTTEADQAGVESGIDFLDLEEMELEDIGGNFHQAMFSSDQPNIWSPLPDFSRLSSPSLLSALPPLLSDPFARGSNIDNHEMLLNIYNSELCILPLTSDTQINPFRFQREISRGPRLLFHSILALCYQHLHFQTQNCLDKVQQYKLQADNELTTAVTKVSSISDLSLLDSILVMFTLDCMLSAAGSWKIHLTRAHTVIESCGGPQALSNARLRSQAGMLLWWDASLALISRKGLVFDSCYFDHLLSHEEDDPWSFYDLAGCPAEVIRSVIELAELAREFELVSTMKWVSFDLNRVLEIEQRLINWTPDKRPASFASPRNPEHLETDSNSASTPDGLRTMVDDESEEEINRAEDEHHCVEAWRQALLIYIRRVFRIDKTSTATITKRQESQHYTTRKASSTMKQLWHGSTSCRGKYNACPVPSSDRNSKPARASMFSLVRCTINHIRCVRQSSQTQKQLLLPAFIAGSETSDTELRSFICDYCSWWSNKSRYKMFDTVSTLLLQIWEEIDKEKKSTTDTSKVYQQPSGLNTASIPIRQSGNNSKGVKVSPWWGSVVDQNTQAFGPQGTPTEYLFG